MKFQYDRCRSDEDIKLYFGKCGILFVPEMINIIMEIFLLTDENVKISEKIDKTSKELISNMMEAQTKPSITMNIKSPTILFPCYKTFAVDLGELSLGNVKTDLSETGNYESYSAEISNIYINIGDYSTIDDYFSEKLNPDMQDTGCNEVVLENLDLKLDLDRLTNEKCLDEKFIVNFRLCKIDVRVTELLTKSLISLISHEFGKIEEHSNKLKALVKENSKSSIAVYQKNPFGFLTGVRLTKFENHLIVYNPSTFAQITFFDFYENLKFKIKELGETDRERTLGFTTILEISANNLPPAQFYCKNEIQLYTWHARILNKQRKFLKNFALEYRAIHITQT